MSARVGVPRSLAGGLEALGGHPTTRGGVGALTRYEVRPHACASIFHASPRFENV